MFICEEKVIWQCVGEDNLAIPTVIQSCDQDSEDAPLATRLF